MHVKLLLSVMTLFILLPGCSEEPAVKVDLSDREETTVSSHGSAYTLAYLPQYSHTLSYERQRRLVEYLRKSTGIPIKQIFPDTFDEHLKMVSRGEIDISLSNPFIYIKIAEHGAWAFARVVEPYGQPDFKGQVICRVDNKNIKSLADCKGKRWIAVDPSSAGGYLFVLGLFMDNGLRSRDFSEIAFAPGPGGKQEKVVLSVYSGHYDIGSIREGTLQILDGKVDLERIRILAETPAYPSWVFAARKGMPRIIVERIAQAMFRLDMREPEDAEILEAAKVSGYIPAKDSDFDGIRELAAKLENF